ncbi:MAG: hypothetical protein KJO88_08855 [Gammaproteobacteria bacterium]|nr:hypothetical protein [Gammaproteobacteria bacterium]
MIATIVLIGCQGLTPGDSYTEIAGIYYLVKVDDTRVPGDVSHDGAPIHVRSGTFIISDDGTIISQTHFISPDGNELSREVRANYRIEDSRLVIQWEGAGVTEAKVEGDNVVMDNHGMIFEYTKS